jgi:hypothetical protein
VKHVCVGLYSVFNFRWSKRIESCPWASKLVFRACQER